MWRLLAVCAAGLVLFQTGCSAGLRLTEPAPANVRPLAVQPAPGNLNELIEGALTYDGQTVTVEGEAIGDIMLRGDAGWVNLNDGTNAVGVWAPAALLRRIRNVGRYRVKGDTVRVTGMFYRADPRHGGDLDIQAARLEVLATGGRQPVALNRRRLVAATGTWAAAALLGGVWWRRRRRQTAVS